jgi:hypothetical protein
VNFLKITSNPSLKNIFNNVSEEDICVYDPFAIKKRNGPFPVLKLSVYLFLSFQFYVFPKISILGNTLECSDFKNSKGVTNFNLM